jgi:iron complex outermembrane receptor protein
MRYIKRSRTGLRAAGVSLAVLALASAAPAHAQDVPADTADETAAPDEGAEENTIVVTGSRILRPEFSFPNPVQTFRAEEIESSGETNLTDFLTDTPALSGSVNSEFNAGSNGFFESAGLNLLNLRNLGFNRTLTLVDGRRHVAGLPGVSSVDVNSIPTDLVQQIDVLTGGTSAIYGADGVSGVVNFVMKQDFEGIAARGQIGISEYGDAGNRFGSITAGTNFAGGRGNVALSYEYSESDRLSNFNRPFTGDPLFSYGLVRNPADFPDDPNVPDNVLLNDLRYADSSRNGAVIVDIPSFTPEYQGNGMPYDLGRPLPGAGGIVQGGSSTPTAGYQGDYLPQFTKHNANFLGHFEVSPALTIFAEAKYVHTDAYTQSQPTFDFFTFLSAENPFITGAIRNAIIPGSGAPFGLPDGILVSRDNFDLGVRADESIRETIRTVVGAKGEITPHLRYELSYVYGQSKADTTSMDDRLADRYYAALDAVPDPARPGQVTCRINLPGQTIIDPYNYGDVPVTFRPGECVPLNILGERVASQAAIDFVTVDSLTRSKITQEVFAGFVTGDFGALFELPGGAIGFALGAEYRKETSSSNPSQEIQQGLLADSGQIAPTSGKFDVKEAYAELNVPLLKDTAFFHVLSFGGAARISDYSTTGRSTTWKLDGLWSPVRDITFRGTFSQAVRAPNISELFAGRFAGFAFISDPCDPVNVNNGSQFRVANCLATLQGLGLTPAQIAAFNPENDPQATASLPSVTGGNPNLIEERARTWTVGAVLRPRFVPGLTVAVDWYNIKLRDAINTATSQEVTELCVDQPTLNNVFCANVDRDPATGFVAEVFAGPQNVANFDTAGLDVTLDYHRNLGGLGKVNVHVVGGYLDKLTFISSQGADLDDDVNEQFSPRYQAVGDVTWTYDRFSINYGLAWFDKTKRYTTEQLRGNPDISDPRYFLYKARWEHDIQLKFAPDERMSFYVGVNNFTDQKPDVAALSYPVSAIGRYYYAGARIKLGPLFK